MSKPLTPDSDEMEVILNKAKIEFNTVYTISYETFSAAACEVLKVRKEKLEVRRCIGDDEHFGKLTVYVYKDDDEDMEYYDRSNGSKKYRHLPTNIESFKEVLSKVIDKKIGGDFVYPSSLVLHLKPKEL
jgi:hypothetical protein